MPWQSELKTPDPKPWPLNPKPQPHTRSTKALNPFEPGQDFAKACADAQLGFVDNLPEKYPGLLQGVLGLSLRDL